MPPADVSYAFPKERRLKSSLQIRNIVQSRVAVSKYPIKCFYEITDNVGKVSECKVAMLVSKRRFKHATDRNRVKRLQREAFRLNYNDLCLPEGSNLYMCWMFVGDDMPSFEQCNASAVGIFTKLNAIFQDILQ